MGIPGKTSPGYVVEGRSKCFGDRRRATGKQFRHGALGKHVNDLRGDVDKAFLCIEDRLDGESVQASVQDLTELALVEPAAREDAGLRFVEEEEDWYYFDDQSTAPAGGDVIVPADAPASGRWIRVAGGLSHHKVRSLIHFISDGPALGFATGAFREILPAGDPFPLSATWYDDASKANKLVELLIVRDGIQNPTLETWNMYDIDGATIVETVVDTMTYIGVFETTRTRAIS